ncbi:MULTISPECIES: putative signal transducing protein [Cellulophaga]|uniref:putative signal transducing protein n=1 Tax=Cellulophaga TaxID=104264 RepID=UPI0003F58931|nr:MULTISPECIES: DUF2007 domain-containing protein [Cellulophaga]
MVDKWVTIATFEYSSDLQVFKAKLESEGITVFVKDENTINSDPMISNAIGGAKVQVFQEDKERALEIYDSIRAYAIGDDGLPITCPNCKAQKSETYYARKSIFYKLFPFFEKRKYKCLNCKMITNPYL